MIDIHDHPSDANHIHHIHNTVDNFHVHVHIHSGGTIPPVSTRHNNHYNTRITAGDGSSMFH